jgi:ribosomal protein S12 methylthiotransferase accessory factor YcaO
MLAPRTEATVHALLDRLERGVAQRARQPKPGPGLQDTLAELRSLAARA